MDRDSLDLFLEKQICTQQEVAEELNISPQMVSKLVKQNKLTPLSSIRGVNVFAIDSVKEYIMKKKGEQVEAPRKIFGGTTRQFISDFEEQIDPDRVMAVYVYSNSYDAILDGFYSVRNDEVKDQLLEIDVPNLIVKLEDLSELYFYGANCGYYGEGPRGTNKVLREKLGVSLETSNYVYNHTWLKLYKDNEGWRCSQSHEISEIDNNFTEQMKGPHYYGKVFLYNRELVILRNSFGKCWDETDYVEFLQRFSEFIPNPTDMTIYTRDEAIKTGHYACTPTGDTVTYQVVIADSSKREIWLDIIVDESKSINEQMNIEEVLDYLGVGLDEKQGEKFATKYIRDLISKKMNIRDRRSIMINIQNKPGKIWYSKDKEKFTSMLMRNFHNALLAIAVDYAICNNKNVNYDDKFCEVLKDALYDSECGLIFVFENKTVTIELNKYRVDVSNSVCGPRTYKFYFKNDDNVGDYIVMIFGA